MWEPLIIGQGIPATGEPVHSALDQHPSSTVAYIQRLREKVTFYREIFRNRYFHVLHPLVVILSRCCLASRQYGLDSSMFTYNSSGPGISASHGSSCWRKRPLYHIMKFWVVGGLWTLLSTSNLWWFEGLFSSLLFVFQLYSLYKQRLLLSIYHQNYAAWRLYISQLFSGWTNEVVSKCQALWLTE